MFRSRLSPWITPIAVALVLSLNACGDDTTGPSDPAATDSDGDGVADADDAFPQDPTESADTDSDGIGNNADPTPGGSTNNKLRSVTTDGNAKIVAISWYDSQGVEDMSYVYEPSLALGCQLSWSPQGTLCDEAPGTDDPTRSVRVNRDAGATWYPNEPGQGEGTGVLVVDACAEGDATAIDFNEVRVFQMLSDGKTSHVRISVHPELGDEPPHWNSSGWEPLGGFAAVGLGRFPPPADGTVSELPLVLATPPRVTRYVRIEARNDGSVGEERYIELRCVKLFSVSHD